MEKNVRFTILGIFVFGLFASIVIIILWLSNYGEDTSYKYYLINTKSSVSGLNIQAPVKFRGVEVGQVSDVFINPNNSEEVSIVIKIKPNTPVKTDTYAILEPQGITGLSYLQLEGGSNSAKELKTSSDNMGIIASRASAFAQLNTVAEKFEKTLSSINNLTNEKNVKNVEVILENIAKASKMLGDFARLVDEQKNDFKKMIEGAKKMEQNAMNAIGKIANMSDTISKAVDKNAISMMEKVSLAADSISVLMDKAEKKLDSGLLDVKGASNELMTPLRKTLYELDSFLNKMGLLVEDLKQSPSDILYKSTSQKPGPGEEK